MAEETRKSKGGSKLARSEITTVRLDPKLRYLAELAARKQRRTLSSFIEWSIEDSLGRLPIREWDGGEITFQERAEELWDVDEADRFAKLAFSFPELMTHDEQVMWKLVKENGFFWRGKYNPEWEWVVQDRSLMAERLREHWPTIKAVAAGEEGIDAMPSWVRRQRPAPAPGRPPAPSGFDDMEDIPF